MGAEGFRLDLLLVTAKLARTTYYYQLKQLDKPDKAMVIKRESQDFYEEHTGNWRLGHTAMMGGMSHSL